MSIEKLHRFRVTGKGAFPLDMLSRNQCFPDTDQGAARINSTWNHIPRSINLLAIEPPRLDEWKTCRWFVHDHEEIPA